MKRLTREWTRLGVGMGMSLSIRTVQAHVHSPQMDNGWWMKWCCPKCPISRQKHRSCLPFRQCRKGVLMGVRVLLPTNCQVEDVQEHINHNTLCNSSPDNQHSPSILHPHPPDSINSAGRGKALNKYTTSRRNFARFKPVVKWNITRCCLSQLLSVHTGSQ